MRSREEEERIREKLRRKEEQGGGKKVVEKMGRGRAGRWKEEQEKMDKW